MLQKVAAGPIGTQQVKVAITMGHSRPDICQRKSEKVTESDHNTVKSQNT